MFGYEGKLLFVDLSAGEAEVRDLDCLAAKDYIGGTALGAKILYDEMPVHTEALSPNSYLGFVSGPANGTGAYFGGRYTIVCKSPVTRGINESNSGGNFGAALRRAGYDAVFFHGACEKPCYTLIDNGKVELHDASRLWGKTIPEAESTIRKELEDPHAEIVLIGPAGERLSELAAILCSSRKASAKGGAGAVMGAKNLKALVVRGDHKIAPWDSEAILALNNEAAAWRKETARSQDKEVSIAPGADGLGSGKESGCNACPIDCSARKNTRDGPMPREKTGYAQHETGNIFSGMLPGPDDGTVQKYRRFCNVHGFDTVSLGSAITRLMTYCRNGLFTRDQLMGFDPDGDSSSVIAAITELIGRNEGIGKILGAGSTAAARYLHKGFEVPAETGSPALPFHGYDLEGMIDMEIANAGGFCKFMDQHALPPHLRARYISAITGFDLNDKGQADKFGLRSLTIRHAFNLREGFRRRDFRLPGHRYESLTGRGQDNLDYLFRELGWNPVDAVPRLETLMRIGGLENVIRDFYPGA